MRARKRIADAILALCAAVLMFSLLYLGSIWLNYQKSNGEYEKINEEATETEPEVMVGDGFTVDWGYLKGINPDIVAWVRFPNLDISYPVVQGEDNEEYLHTTINGTDAYAGSIFMDAVCNPDFSDDNTVIYGHNMRNLSMFGGLKNLYRDETVLRDNEYFWIYTEKFAYKYEIFALGNAKIANECFGFVNGSDEEKQEYINFCMAANMFEMPAKADADDYIVTLSTCTASRSETDRFQVHGIRTEAYPSRIK